MLSGKRIAFVCRKKHLYNKNCQMLGIFRNILYQTDICRYYNKVVSISCLRKNFSTSLSHACSRDLSREKMR